VAYGSGDCTIELLFGWDEYGSGVFFVGEKVVFTVAGYPRVLLKGGGRIR